MPTTLPLRSPHVDAWLGQSAPTKTSNLDFVAVVAFATAGLLLSLAFAALFPISEVASLMASVS